MIWFSAFDCPRPLWQTEWTGSLIRRSGRMVMSRSARRRGLTVTPCDPGFRPSYGCEDFTVSRRASLIIALPSPGIQPRRARGPRNAWRCTACWLQQAAAGADAQHQAGDALHSCLAGGQRHGSSGQHEVPGPCGGEAVAGHAAPLLLIQEQRPDSTTMCLRSSPDRPDPEAHFFGFGKVCLGVAQLGRATHLECVGRWFKSSRPDQLSDRWRLTAFKMPLCEQ